MNNDFIMSKKCDLDYMHIAFSLAALGEYTTSPNPNVGCLIVNHGRVVGEGYHERAGEPHAEIRALNMAKEEARGATAYVTLEPCVHRGKTPPCADALIQAGIRRVVIAQQDPNPLVAGKGLKKLKTAGISVTTGILTDQAETLNAGFLKRMRQKSPYVRLKMAASIDGKTAMPSGESKWITSTLSRQDVQQYRAKSCAILSTSATVVADDPALTVRWHDLPATLKQRYAAASLRQPIRIILDSQNKLTFKEKLFNEPGEIWLVTKKPITTDQARINVQVLVDQSTTKKIDLVWLFNHLAEKEINSVWVEAGAHLAGSLIAGKFIDELILYMAPKLLGRSATDLCILPELTRLADAPSFNLNSIKQFDNDIRCVFTPKT